MKYEIELIKILVYRSAYGSEITAKRWLSQFYFKQRDSLKYGSDIQAISGATVSASSLTENVNRINKLIREKLKD
jgi:K+-transporting ATPase c subunit